MQSRVLLAVADVPTKVTIRIHLLSFASVSETQMVSTQQ